MTSACLREKSGWYYIVISYYDEEHKRKQIWEKTEFRIRGNKRKAEELLMEYQRFYDIEKRKLVYEQASNSGMVLPAQTIMHKPEADILFGDYIDQWVDELKDSIEITTYNGYKGQINYAIKPYFNSRKITLSTITEGDIALFYKVQLKRVSPTTIRHYHANIRKCLQEAYINNLILCNPADKVKLPKSNTYVGKYYTIEELKELLEKIRGSELEFPVIMGIHYGLRRSEIAGLKWSAVDFEYKTIKICHTMTYTKVDGEYRITAKDRAKTFRSIRTLPLMPVIEEMLLKMKAKQDENRDFFKNCYEENDYIYVHEDGSAYNPNFISTQFCKFLRKMKLKKIRFHDLRHSCATLLRHGGVRMEDIQKWLGHSQLATTEKIYAHFQEEQHVVTAGVIINLIDEPKKMV